MQTSNRTTLLRRREMATVIRHKETPPEWGINGTFIIIRPKRKPADPVQPKPAEAAQDKVSEAEEAQAKPKTDEPEKDE